MDFRDYVYYDENSPSGLRWAVSTVNGKRRAGDLAGWRGTDGYWYVQIENKTYKAHRIIVILDNQDIPEGFVVDHINLNNGDNSLSNLRVVKREVNLRNTKQYINNTSGTKGVCYDKKVNCWRACWRGVDDKAYSKSFYVPKYGEDAKHLAIAYRNKMLQELNEYGRGYTEQHQNPFVSKEEAELAEQGIKIDPRVHVVKGTA